MQFASRDSRQLVQRIVLDFPSGLDPESRTVEPPFKEGIDDALFKILDLLKVQIPHEKMDEPSQHWVVTDSVPVALTVEYFTSAGDLRTDKLLYEMDFVYRAHQTCLTPDNCRQTPLQFGLTNFRYERLLGRFEQPKSTVDVMVARKHFKFDHTY